MLHIPLLAVPCLTSADYRPPTPSSPPPHQETSVFFRPDILLHIRCSVLHLLSQTADQEVSDHILLLLQIHALLLFPNHLPHIPVSAKNYLVTFQTLQMSTSLLQLFSSLKPSLSFALCTMRYLYGNSMTIFVLCQQFFPCFCQFFLQSLYYIDT